MTTGEQIAITSLYVPGDRPERFDKAVATGTDVVILDLEDGVAPANKATAREAVVAWVAARESGPPVIEVRVNAGDGDDLAALRGLEDAVVVKVPKVESSADIDAVIAVLPGARISALIETALGVERALEIAAHPAVIDVSLGEADLASDLGSRHQAVLDHARIRLLFAARAAGKAAPMMSVYADIADLDGLRADTERARAMGFVGRTAIHPSQVAVIRAAFAPDPADVQWANDVVTVMAAGGVTTLANGEMVDPAMLGRARAILALDAAQHR
ncbi:HpcH/HpaI aldolase/citrate lyase family protein [Desertimonas flava]|uniref:HpcH/HpaI aldolase/citrate lyase family protein n=1 Tax=Desertimonas flava TaxID=2064846 RepID=UPI000E340CF9|nr:CoA ester lyase [Desertimonas flava]